MTRIYQLIALGCAWLLPAPLPGQDFRSVFGTSPEVTTEFDVPYGAGGGEPWRLDLARPKSPAGPAACVVVIHGGAWRTGNKAFHRDIIERLAKAGYVAATVGYRFCPQHPFPAQVEDVKCAVRFLRASAAKYQIDPQHFGALGFSAGAHLAMMLGVMGKGDGLEGNGGWADQESQVQAVVAYFGPTDLTVDDMPLISRGLLKDFLGGTPTEKPDQYRQASPLTYVTAGDAPLLIFQGTKDPLVPHTQAYRMADALTNAGVPGRVELLLGAGHGWGGELLDHTTAETIVFFDKYLRSAKER